MATNTPDGMTLFHLDEHELKTHLKNRGDYHAKRNEKLVAEAKTLDEKLRETVDGADSVSDRMATKGSSSYANDAMQRDSNLQRARTHAQLATKFFFLAEHLPKGTEIGQAKFELTLDELQRLEFF